VTYTNPLIDAWANGRQLLGSWCTLPSSLMAEIAGRQGLDYVCVDLQHGMIDDSSSISMLQGIAASGSIPIVRSRWNEPAAIMSALDSGALGIVVPMINNAKEAIAAIDACRYPPFGHRSYGPIRARDIIGSTNPRELEKVACILMIETIESLENLDEILSVTGLDAIYIGPSDLALSLGFAPGSGDPKIAQTIDEIVSAARRHKIPVGIQCGDGDGARFYLEKGFDFITVFSDAGLYAWAAKLQLSLAKKKPDDDAAKAKQLGNY